MKGFLLFLLFSLYITIQSKEEEQRIAEILDETISVLKAKYITEKDPKEKAYLEIIVKPELSDLNKDNKISHKELKNAILNTLGIDQEVFINIDHDILNRIESNIDVFLLNIPKYLNYKQFMNLISQLHVNHFIEDDVAKKILIAKKEGREHESDL